MVWSDQSQFPFYVIDNNGNVILTIDETGLHLDGATGHIDMQVSAGQPTIFFANLARTIRAYINAPGGSSVAIGSPDYASTLPGTPNVHNISWVSAGQTEIGQVKQSSSAFVGGYINAENERASVNYVDENSFFQTRVIAQSNGILIGDGGALLDGIGWSKTTGFLHRVIDEVYKSWNIFTGTYSNGWSDLGGNWSTGAYKLTPDGFVKLRGVLIGGTKTDGTVITTLPVEARPAKDKIIPMGLISAGATQPNVNVRVFAATGQLQCFGISATTSGNLTLEGMNYSLEG